MNGERQPDAYVEQRRKMVAVQLCRRGIRDERVLATMDRVRRHEFVVPELWSRAYDDDPLPIGQGQTVSQPYIVAYMLQALEIAPEHKVLEIGTGTGYQAALLAELAREVITVERIAALAEAARRNLQAYPNVTVVDGDGSQGWMAGAPYGRIVVAAAAPEVPAALVDQLAPDGKMILPVGSSELQELMLVEKRLGSTTVQRLEGCRFVPLIGVQGFTPNSVV